MGAESSKQESTTFDRFSKLPPEIRQIIWRYHFTRPRLHIIWRVWVGGTPAPPYLNKTISPSPSPSPQTKPAPTTTTTTTTTTAIIAIINREAYAAARAALSHRYPVPLAWDVTRALDPDSLQALAAAAARGSEQHGGGHERDTRIMPLSVDWAADLVSVAPHLARGFLATLRFFSGHGWTAKIQKLAVYFDMLDVYAFHQDQTDGSGFFDRIARRLEAFRSLREIHVVCGVSREAAAAATWCYRPRNDFGFVPLSLSLDIDIKTRQQQQTQLSWRREGVFSWAPLAATILLEQLTVLLRDCFGGGDGRRVEVKIAVKPEYHGRNNGSLVLE